MTYVCIPVPGARDRDGDATGNTYDRDALRRSAARGKNWDYYRARSIYEFTESVRWNCTI